MVVRRLIHTLWLCLFLGLVPVHAEVVDIAQASEWHQPLSKRVLLYQDLSGHKDPQQVSVLPEGPGGFVPITQIPTPGKRSPQPWWTKVQLANTGETSRSLRLILTPGIAFRSADFYIQQNGLWRPVEPVTEGADMPATARFHATAINLAPGENQTVLIRTTGAAPTHLTPYLYSEHLFRNYLARSSVWDGLLFGGLLALAWTACMLAAFARSRSFFVLGLLSFSTLLIEALRRGYDRLYILPEALDWSYRGALVLSNLTILLFIVFVMEIARAEKVHLPLRKLVIGWVLYYLGLILLSIFGNVYHVFAIAEPLKPFFSLTLLAIAVLFAKNNAPTRKLMLAIAVFSLARAGVGALETYNLLPDYFASLSMGTLRMNPAVALAGLFLNLALLAGWVAHVGTQRKKAWKEISRLQREENQRLTKEVARQTADLNKALQYADEKNRQQTQIMGYISHDLRAPLATITGYAKLIEKSASSQQKPLLDAITRSADYQMTLINDILGYAAAELKPLSLTSEPVHLADYLDEITQHAVALSKQQNNRFIAHAHGQIPETIRLDGRRLRQVLLNLLSNAAKFTHNGTIRLDLLAKQSGTNWKLRFTVRDSGIGIDQERQAQIFNEFHQLEPSLGGVGLGLFIAQSILRAMGTELKLESAIGEGSAFSFEILAVANDTQAISWSAPETLPEQSLFAMALTGVQQPNALTESSATGVAHNLRAAMPPAHVRDALASMARGGHLTDIESWLTTMAGKYPSCAAYFSKIGEALQRLDLDTIERLALVNTNKRGN